MKVTQPISRPDRKNLRNCLKKGTIVFKRTENAMKFQGEIGHVIATKTQPYSWAEVSTQAENIM